MAGRHGKESAEQRLHAAILRCAARCVPLRGVPEAVPLLQSHAVHRVPQEDGGLRPVFGGRCGGGYSHYPDDLLQTVS